VKETGKEYGRKSERDKGKKRVKENKDSER
jgi:hypothetical protein